MRLTVFAVARVAHVARALCLASVLAAALPAQAIDDLFERRVDNPLSGFQPAQDARYQKECSGCHFVYLPGMLPARSWTLLLDRLDKHFGENIDLQGEAREAIRRYLVDNAADRSAYSASKVLMESLPADFTPQRVQSVPRIRSAHRVMREVIARNGNVKVRTFFNCDGCHQRAEGGDFSLPELRVEGLKGLSLVKSSGYKDR
jgi:hypothetical protein